MLDAEHGTPEGKSAGDDNSYYLGRMGGHDVVIACLPAGSLGSASAATVAAQMQCTFTRVRVGLLIGIGSGAPSEADDIRLGDVVVSMPSGDTGGVIPYRCKSISPAVPATAAIGGGSGSSSSSTVEFVRSRCLNKPPMMLLTALSSLQAEHRLTDSKINALLAQAAQQYPKLRTQLMSPSHGSGAADRLYQAQYQHAGLRGSACDGCCDKSMLVPWRAEDGRRPVSDCGPAVHYGVVATGEQELECGIARDEAKQALSGVLCFEREAAGLMDNFPCLVVRGICDYADTHKSSRWQSYAAGTAAAFAKELLEMLPPREVQLAPTLVEAMQVGEFLPDPEIQKYLLLIVLLLVHMSVKKVENVVKGIKEADEAERSGKRCNVSSITYLVEYLLTK
jgi:nucleoside phosphorylase